MNRAIDAPCARAPRRLYAWRAIGVAAASISGALPAALGAARCPSATFLHVACPGCGMTRATHLLLAGDVRASIAMHPLAAPTIVATTAVAVALTWATLVRGTPAAITQLRAGRAALALFAAVYALMIVLWAARAIGAFGGLPPV